jgi:hypothetical protein
LCSRSGVAAASPNGKCAASSDAPRPSSAGSGCSKVSEARGGCAYASRRHSTGCCTCGERRFGPPFVRQGVVVRLRLRRRRRVCGRCGQLVRATHETNVVYVAPVVGRAGGTQPGVCGASVCAARAGGRLGWPTGSGVVVATDSGRSGKRRRPARIQRAGRRGRLATSGFVLALEVSGALLGGLSSPA